MQHTPDATTANGIATSDDALVVVLRDRSVRIPWRQCSPRLASASADERRRAELSPGGYGIHWPLLDEDLSVNRLVEDHDG